MSDEIFQDAVEALREGNKSKARDLLTGLLKTDQSNATYWVWMSATVDSTKERIYCLQTAYKLDPENATAKRGLILLGAMPADETVQPFPVNRPRAWEARLLLAHEKPKPKGWQAVKQSPVFRLGVIGAVATNAKLTKVQATKVAQMAQDGLAQAIRPAHTMFDGDTIFALATGKKEADVSTVGAFAAEVVAQAIVRAVKLAEPAGGLPGLKQR